MIPITITYLNIFTVLALVYAFKFFMLNDLRGYPVMFTVIAFTIGLVYPAVISLLLFLMIWLTTLI